MGQERALSGWPADRPLPFGYIHTGVAQEITPTLLEFGTDPDPLIRDAGLESRLFDNGTNVIPLAALGRLLTLSVARTGCPHFGLLVGRRTTILSLGLVGRLMLHSSTVGDALRCLVLHLSIEDGGAVPALAVEDATALFSYSVYRPEVESTNQIADGAIACAVNVLRDLCGAAWAPSEVFLPRVAPVDQEPYRCHFRAPVRFDQEIAAITFPARDLRQRIAGADPLLRAVLEERISHLASDPRSELADHVRRMLRTGMPGDQCSAGGVAGLLEMSRRTLNRRLRAEGTRFRAVANEIRFEIARQLLADTSLSFAQIAAVLDYSEASAFTRAFRRLSGQTPKSWRAEHRLGMTPAGSPATRDFWNH
jgi:AraC-like DNA-binding protein